MVVLQLYSTSMIVVQCLQDELFVLGWLRAVILGLIGDSHDLQGQRIGMHGCLMLAR